MQSDLASCNLAIVGRVLKGGGCVCSKGSGGCLWGTVGIPREDWGKLRED